MVIDLEGNLRTMLRDRAEDITVLPVHLTTLEPSDRPRSQQARTRWMMAAAAAAVLVVGLLAALLRPGKDAVRPPAGSQTPPATPTSHAPRKVHLDWFGMRRLPGYDLNLRQADPGVRVLAVRKTSDPQQPYGCNGCESASAYVRVFDRGVFAADRYGVPRLPRVDVNGAVGHLGAVQGYPDGRRTLRSIAWQYGPDEWALVQGVTDVGSSTGELLRVARAVQPTVDVPIRVPFRLGYVPNLPITDITDDRNEGYALSIRLGSIEGRMFDITVWPSDPNDVPETAAYRRLIGGRTGYYDRARAVAEVAIWEDYVADFGIAENAPPAAESRSLTARDRHDMDLVVRNISWTGRTVIPAEQAIP
jgi:hypothetical protein